ncbi:MAG: UMP kinase [Proteobacteria bacterium]|nr:UMP kinase [Pseudomonadota bacterium]
MTHRRVMIKLSGEILGRNSVGGLDQKALEHVCSELSLVSDLGYEIACVIGGGNFFRGSLAAEFGLERATADYMGMLATCINGLALQAILENKFKKFTRVLTAITMTELAEEYIQRKAIKHLKRKRIILFVCGTGNPLFTTDTAASLRALEIGASIILKGTKVDGIYDKDPKKHDDAKKFDQLSYLDMISKNLNVMDSTAITMCMEAKVPIKVFNLANKGSILRALDDPKYGTLVS